MSAWKLGPTQRLLNLFFQVCFSPLHLHTSLVQKKVQEVFLELTERGERVSKGSPRGQLSTVTPAEAPVRDGRVTEGWPCHRGMAVSQKTAVRMESFECRSAAQGRKGSARRPPVHKPGLFWALCLQLPEGRGSRASR